MINLNYTKILYLCEGAGFAGVESYAISLIRKMTSFKDMKCYVATFYKGLLREQLHCERIETVNLYGRSNLKSIRHIINFADTEKIDIIHCVDLKSTIVGGIASLFLKKVKIIATIHGLPEPYHTFGKQLKLFFSLSIYYLFLRYLFDGKICVSNDLRDKVKKFIRAEGTAVIHNGIELPTDGSCQYPSVLSDTFVIGTVGRLDTVKGHVYLLEAAKMLIAERDDVVFQIIGSGPLEDSLKTIAKHLGVSERVHFLGFRPDAKTLIAGMDIFVLPSLHEGIPYVLLEAMASSKPVICSGVGGVNEIVTNNWDGILVHPKDSLELYRALNKLILKRSYMISLGKNAHDTIQNSFSAELMSINTYSFYGRVLPQLSH